MIKPISFLPNAPEELIYLFGKISQGKEILGRLLADQRMKRSWMEIKKKCRDAENFRRLWGEIFYRFKKSNFPPRAKVGNRLRRAAKKAIELREIITNTSLDRPAFDFFSNEDGLAVFMVGNWETLEKEERQSIAYQRLPYWHSMEEFLLMLAQRAESCAKETMTNKRIAERDTHEKQLNYFVRHLAIYFCDHFGGPMKGTLANIASVVFEKSINESFDKEYVSQRLRHEKGGA